MGIGPAVSVSMSWVVDFEVLGLGSRICVLGPGVLILDYAKKQWEEEKKYVLNKTKTFNFKFVLFSQMPWPRYVMF